MENTYTHLIITRFMCDNFIPEYIKDVTTKEWEDMSFDMAKRHIIATLENQSNQNFILIFLVGNNISDDIIDRIYNLSNKLSIKVVKLRNLDKYISCINTDYLITSRLDYDDHIYKDCVNDIQSLLNDSPEVKLWGINQGVSLVDGELIPHLMRREVFEQNKDGFFAPMISLVLRKDVCKKYFDVYKLGFHIDCIRNFLNIQSVYMNRDNYTLNEIYTTTDETELYYIWIRHKHSASTIVWNLIHSTNIEIKISETELKERFGYSI